MELYRHNREAYESVKILLSKTGKAAVIHPTGTGKSFIGFKYCEDNPDKKILWLSPSEYIFKTQLDNLQKADGKIPQNIKFFTYSKLMNMSQTEIENLKADAIVLDEFHRCGAMMWGEGVKHLLNTYPNAKILGLSATNIRYLDNRRDMADELFEGNVASEMTLGEAIVRGILNPPKYVLSVFSYQSDLEKYARRVKHAKNKAIRDTAEKYLEALRRTLEQADGLDDMFAKHMDKKHGKYIVFCPSKEDMDVYMDKSKEWFAKVDQAPNFYSAYSDDPETGKALDNFKKDNSDHLKLLFCIDMLNEGIHVDDIDGVILLRPTVSPIIYKQQIGRALSAGKHENAVIFDVVMNIENLYGIETIQQEIKAAVTYYREHGESENIVNQQFKVIDQLRDCLELFEKLNDTLTASWDVMYDYARQYYETNQNLDIPKRYKTQDGYSLGSWIATQRKIRNGEQYGKLDEDRIAKLNAIGMRWESYKDAAWEKYFKEAQKYYEKHGNLLINVSEISGTIPLGRWISNLRTYRKSGIKSGYLTQERIEMLDSIGMVWDVPDYLWEQNYNAALQYYRQHGNLKVPLKYTDNNGIKLGRWIHTLRTSQRNGTSNLTQEQIDKLNELGMIWSTNSEQAWERAYKEAEIYFKANGHLNVPKGYKTPTGFALSAWLGRIRCGDIRLTDQRKSKLESLGMVWSKPDPWETRFNLVKAYYDAHGDLKIPAQYKTDDVNIYKWLHEQKQIYRGKRHGKHLSDEQIQKLSSLGLSL